MRKKSVTDVERVRELTKLWLQRPVNERTSNDVLVFYGWLETNRPDLLKRSTGDPYQHLQAELARHVKDESISSSRTCD